MLEVASVFRFPCSSVFQVFFFKCSTRNKGEGPVSKWLEWGENVGLCCHHWSAVSVLVNMARMRTTVPFLGWLPFCAGSDLVSGGGTSSVILPQRHSDLSALGPEGFHLQTEGKKYPCISWELHSTACCRKQKDNHTSSDQSQPLAELYISLQ